MWQCAGMSRVVTGRVSVLCGLAAMSLFCATATAAVPALRQLSGQDGCWAEFAPDDELVVGPCHVMRGITGSVLVSGVQMGPYTAISPDGRSVYRATAGASTKFGSQDSTLVAFTREPRTGALHQLAGRRGCLTARLHPNCRHVRGMGFIGGLTVSPDGTNLYAASQFDEGVVTLRRDPATGALRQLPGRAGCTLRQPRLGCARAHAWLAGRAWLSRPTAGTSTCSPPAWGRQSPASRAAPTTARSGPYKGGRGA
jgi:hypothetical protein